ncbi:MAG: leucine--tRNA ligase [Thermoguttaceae bacterium]|nr:leucine--tRNA ligase [Thermoguttaceae bacterium]
MRYNPAVVEPKWQEYWKVNNTFAVDAHLPEGAKKKYVLDMFPYPSGNGLHVGHPEGYTATDIVCRYSRMNGFSVMHPMGWDAFGLPAEQYAKKTGIHPRITTHKNIDRFRSQLQALGFSYDWNRELATTDVDYFRWTQFIFLVLFDTWFDAEQQKGRPISELPIPDDVKAQGDEAVRRYQDEHRLAYQSYAPVNWCAELGTVLANEEVIGGVSERGGFPVVRMPMRQWMLRITAYADRLEKDLELLNWPEGVKALQRNWIGRSIGAEVDFYIGDKSKYEDWKAARAKSGFPKKPDEDSLRIYTTRPDTLFGATYMVISPEHPAVDRLTTPEQAAAVKAYQEEAAHKSEMDRTDLNKDKTGVFTGFYAINPVNGKPIPVWIADYVLISYGTGAIMAVPAHDTRDFDFAKKFDLPIIPVVDPQVTSEEDKKAREELFAGTAAFIADGVAINSEQFNGTPTAEFKKIITQFVADGGFGRQAINYKLRDWLFSRQHIWGEPFPILHELDENGKRTGLMRIVPADELPIDLPKMEKFDVSELAKEALHTSETHEPEPPLSHAPAEWLYQEIDGKKYIRETNTMPQWAGSCWYYLRYLDPKNDKAFVDPAIEKAWMPVDLYVGGAEHAVLHLLYARFWHKVLYDRGYVSTKEPFQRLVNQGMILGENGEKMSKSRGNVINPDDVVAEHGADSLRLYEMFMGPLEVVKPWSETAVGGVHNFLGRVWRLVVDEEANGTELCSAVQDVACTEEQRRVLHKTIKAVTQDVENMAFNTAISRMMEFTNFFTRETVRPKKALEQFVLLLSPFAPHIAEELWQALGHNKTLAYEPWPTWDESALVESTKDIPVSINGKMRAVVTVPINADKDSMRAAAVAEEKIAKQLEGKTIVKEIIVPGKMVNFVVK